MSLSIILATLKALLFDFPLVNYKKTRKLSLQQPRNTSPDLPRHLVASTRVLWRSNPPRNTPPPRQVHLPHANSLSRVHSSSSRAALDGGGGAISSRQRHGRWRCSWSREPRLGYRRKWNISLRTSRTSATQGSDVAESTGVCKKGRWTSRENLHDERERQVSWKTNARCRIEAPTTRNESKFTDGDESSPCAALDRRPRRGGALHAPVRLVHTMGCQPRLAEE